MRTLMPARPGPQLPAAVPGPRRPPVPGGALLQPVSLVALAVLVVNDHGLKARWGTEPLAGAATGKVSDVAGLVFFPLLLVSLVELARWARAATPRRAAGWRRTAFTTGSAFTGRDLVVAAAVTGVGFAAVQTVPVAAEAYSQGLAFLRWLPSGLAAAVTGASSPPLPSVDHTRDPTDALCLPALWWSYRIGRRILHSRAKLAGTVPAYGPGTARAGGIGAEGSGA